ncbi:elongation factor Tu [Streptomyces zinciresistens K42]|uniref:Elongation factor Tu n=1 Tax=Streptomyces zinciresistens K42 TaxID=700597 RepID=G2GHL4_9ACTN|nr:elongation factor Tu [Streptomyces zinciresistens K42]
MRTTAVASGYRPQSAIRTADVAGDVDLGEAGVALPGRTVTTTVEPGRAVPLEPGLGFAVREGGRTVGAGTVTAAGWRERACGDRGSGPGRPAVRPPGRGAHPGDPGTMGA